MLMRVGALIGKFALTLFLAKFVSLESVAIYGMIAGAAILVPVGLSMGVAQSIVRDAAHQEGGVTARRVHLYFSVILIQYAALLVVAFGYFLYVDRITPLLIIAVVFLEHLGNDSANLLLATRRPLAANTLIFIRSALWIYLYILAAVLSEATRSIDSLLAFWICGGIVAAAIAFMLFK
jgi:hypothetical protein